MIKVIASDMDGTLLGDDHRIAPETLAAIRRACDAGIRFMVATGRNFPGAMEELKGTELTCDYVVSSGAEVRNPQQEVVKSTPISIELCEEVYNTAKMKILYTGAPLLSRERISEIPFVFPAILRYCGDFRTISSLVSRSILKRRIC